MSNIEDKTVSARILFVPYPGFRSVIAAGLAALLLAPAAVSTSMQPAAAQASRPVRASAERETALPHKPGARRGAAVTNPAGAHAAIPKPLSVKPAASVSPPVTALDKRVSIAVRPNCEVSGAVFTLGEIADIRGEDLALTQQLSAMEVGASPLPGLSRIINPGDITVRLRQHRLDGPRIELALPPGVRITRLGHDIASDEVTRAAIESAKDAIKSEPNSTLEAINCGAKIIVPAGKSQVLAGAWRGNPEIGTLTVPVSILIDGRPVQVVDVALRIHRKTIALVALHDIQLHDIIGPRDVALTAVELTTGQGTPITELAESLGKRATRKIAAKSAIGAEMLEKAPIIAANDSVTIEFSYGALRVTTTGLARQSGAEGDTIHVFAVDTRRELDGIVVDKHTVRVEDDSNR